VIDSVISDTVYMYLWLHNLAIYLLKFQLPVLFEYSIKYSSSNLLYSGSPVYLYHFLIVVW